MPRIESDDWTRDLSQLNLRLEDSSLLLGLTEEDRYLLLQTMVREAFAADEVIVRQDTMTNNLCLLLTGTCEVTKEPPLGEHGEPVTLAELEPFDVFGEMSLFGTEPHCATVWAKTNVCTLRLRGADFEELAEKQPRLACQIACNMVQIVGARLRGADQKLVAILDGREASQMQNEWSELRARLGQLYAGSP